MKRKGVKRKDVKRNGVKRRRVRRAGVMGVIREKATRKSEDENRLGLTWRSRIGMLRERDFAAFDRNLLAAQRMGRKIEYWIFGKPTKPENSAYDYVGKEI